MKEVGYGGGDMKKDGYGGCGIYGCWILFTLLQAV